MCKWVGLLSRKNHFLIRCWSWPLFSNLDWGTYDISVAKTNSVKIGSFIRPMKFLSTLEILDELQKQLCRSVDPSLAASLEPFAHCWNKVSLRFFCRYYFGRCLFELAQLVPLPKSRGRSTRYSDGLHDLYITIPSFFPCTAKLFLEFSAYRLLSFTYDLNSFNSRINRHLLSVGFFEQLSCMHSIFFSFFFL